MTYKAATAVEQLYVDLLEIDRMLPACPGIIGTQTLAGALGTGTRGQGLGQSTLSDATLSMKVMLADGEIQLVDRDDPRFGAFMLSMGCLEIVLEVSFRTVPNVIMKCRKLTVDQEWLIANHERLNQEHLFVKTWWFAWIGEAHIWLVDAASEFEVQVIGPRDACPWIWTPEPGRRRSWIPQSKPRCSKLAPIPKTKPWTDGISKRCAVSKKATI